jgi:hypothetical protein
VPSRTREEMEQIIDRGESVFVRTMDGGLKIVHRREDIPPEADLAAVDRAMAERAGASGDNASLIKAAADREAAAKAQAEAEIRRLQDQIDKLSAPKVADPVAPKPVPPVPPPPVVPVASPAPAPAKVEAKK